MAIAELEAQIGETASRLGPSVVGVGRAGSGFVVAPGRVLTNAHNLRHEETAVVFNDGRRAAGALVGSDPDLDLAVVEADTGSAVALQWPVEDPGTEIGRAVLALANPGGRGLHVTPGHVSSTTRSFRGPRGRRVRGAVEHTAPLPRGSSGGPLVDSEGRLVGINAVRVDGGLILAISADPQLGQQVQALGRGEHRTRPRLGVAIAPPRVAKRLQRAVGLPERDGVLVRAVQDDSPAQRAGIVPGDLLVSAGGATIDRTDALYDALDGAGDGGSLELRVLRGGDERSVVVEL